MMNEPIRIFIGASANGEDAEAEAVYEYSLRKNSSVPLEITWMRQSHDVNSLWGGWRTEHWSTPFSGFRWAIPEACGFQGKAIYTDVDMVNFRDIADLFNTEFEPGKAILARDGKRFGGSEFCVLVFDCAAMQRFTMPVEYMKKIPEIHHYLVSKLSGSAIVQSIDPRWNCLDGDGREVDDIWQLHFTEMSTQPWEPSWFTGVRRPHPRPDLCELWWDLCEEAASHGYHPNRPTEPYGPYAIVGH